MSQIKTGLTSVTFRQKSPEEIVKLAAKAGLRVGKRQGTGRAPDPGMGRKSTLRNPRSRPAGSFS